MEAQHAKASRKKSLFQKRKAITKRYWLLFLFCFTAIVAIPLSLFFVSKYKSAQAMPRYWFGTLETDPARASQEYRAGVRVVMQTIAWKDYEPADGIFDENYMADVKNRIKIDLAAGMKVVISPALHYPPTWVMNLPGARYVNQYGMNAPPTWAGGYEEPNFVFSQTVRDRVAQFETSMMHQLASDPAIGFKNIWAIRYVNGSLGEAMYPSANDQQGHTNSYWGFDANAQGQAADRPTTIPSTPFPGWQPGERTYNSQPFSTTQVQQWYSWYFNAHTDFVNWHTQLYRNPHGINYQGDLQLQTPGFGARAFEYYDSLLHYLDGSHDPNGVVASAAVWYKLYPALTRKANVIAYVSSMADGSGIPRDDDCHGGEAHVDYTTDPQVNNWSAARYITGLADKYGMKKNGENPGFEDPHIGVPYNLFMMQKAASQMASCQFQGMFWAHDADLYSGKARVTLQQYTNVITRYNFTAKSSSNL